MTPPVYRLEVGRARRPEWAWFLRLAKKMPGYRISREDDLELHVVETTSLANLAGLHEIIREWKGWAFSVDGAPATRRALAELIAQRRRGTIGSRPPRVPRAPAPKVDANEQRRRASIKRFLDGWTSEDWANILEQMGDGTTLEQARAAIEKSYLAQRKPPARPDPDLGF